MLLSLDMMLNGNLRLLDKSLSPSYNSLGNRHWIHEWVINIGHAQLHTRPVKFIPFGSTLAPYFMFRKYLLAGVIILLRLLLYHLIIASH
jgi:hypothetical protein